jgi:MtN3 and saliva related transmembrane protein
MPSFLRTDMMLQNHLGYVAGVLTVLSFLPQVIRAWRTRQTRDLSLSSFAILITAGTLWMVYGAMSRDWPVIATNAGMVTLNLALATAKIRYR